MNTKQFNRMHYESKGFKKRMLFPDVKITPELAQDLLTLNSHNRPIKNPSIKKYTDDMSNGRWEFIGDTIAISNEGVMLNGQHRLMAIINSGVTHEFHIQSGLHPNAFNKMDINKIRTQGDTLAVKGYSNYATVATIVRFVTVFYDGRLEQYLNSKHVKFSNQDIADAADKLDRELLQKSAAMSSRLYSRFRFLDKATIGPLNYIFSKINEGDAYNFFDMLCKGDGISSTNYPSLYLLRNKLIASMNSGSRITEKHRWVIILKAWNSYRTNKPLKQLTYNENEAFPKPI